MTTTKSLKARMQGYLRQQRKLCAHLAQIGFIWPGTITRSMLTCGNKNCACHRDPNARHGPYIYWTSKKQGQSVAKILSPEEADLYEEWIENRRQAARIMRQMKKLSRRAARTALKLRKQSQKAREPP